MSEDVAKDLVAALNAKQPLPTGMAAFDAWAERIIANSSLPADPDSQKFALATMLMHLGPTEDWKEDSYFIKSLRKAAVNQVAHAKMSEIRDAAKLRLVENETKP